MIKGFQRRQRGKTEREKIVERVGKRETTAFKGQAEDKGAETESRGKKVIAILG